ncbi:MAG TPA: biotin--[acetyl-CoA-carboxylase] ligase [Verrucomicrobiae bacterium]|jgi:BirA family biotin operon repressor/biotin-[acetyl-CoA-carboxylase] ligase|nr:biotin--[acetyl-CoA-carboxylase] ligase [Verrucomicrobiae bacterium]
MSDEDLLLPEALAPFVRNTIFAGHIHYWPEVESTNTLALQAAALAGPAGIHGEVFLADEQTAGRGRSDHAWYSERGVGIYASFLLRPRISPADILWLSLLAALSVHDAVEEVTGLRADIRWPNDLLLSGKKFCGILTEASSDSTRIQYAVVGIGINVNQTWFPRELASTATSLRQEHETGASRVQLAAALIRCLDRDYGLFVQAASRPAAANGYFGPIMDKIAARSSYIHGKSVHVDEEGGYTGVTDGLDPRGFLRVRTDRGVRTVISGSVRPLARRADASGP